MDGDIVGAIKIKDGLFIGDEYAAQDLEFIVTNKVARVINTAARQIPNHWETIGVVYLSFPWFDNDTQIIFDAKDEVFNKTIAFIEEGLAQGGSVLVHSLRGQSRSSSIVAAYLMQKFSWTLYKSLEFLHSRHPELEIRTNFFNQLVALESKLVKNGQAGRTFSWDEVPNGGDIDSEELLLRNTFLNARPSGSTASPEKVTKETPSRSRTMKVDRLRWSDNASEDKTKLQTLIIPADPVMRKGKIFPKNASIKSILKGSDKVFQLKIEEEAKSVEATAAVAKVAEQPKEPPAIEAPKKVQEAPKAPPEKNERSASTQKPTSSAQEKPSERGSSLPKRTRNEEAKRPLMKTTERRANRPSEPLLLPKDLDSSVKQNGENRFETADPSPSNVIRSREPPFKNLLTGGKQLKSGEGKGSGKSNKVTRRDLTRLAETGATGVKLPSPGQQETPTGTLLIGNGGLRSSLKQKKQEEEEQVEAAPAATRPVEPRGRPPTASTRADSTFAASFTKQQQVQPNEPLRLPKYTIDSSIFMGFNVGRSFAAPRVNNFLNTSSSGANNRSGPLRLAHDLYEHFAQKNNSKSSSFQHQTSGLRDENDKIKGGVLSVAVQGRPATVPANSIGRPQTGQTAPFSMGKAPQIQAAPKRQSSAQPSDRMNSGTLPSEDRHKMRNFSPGQTWSFSSTLAIYGGRGKV
eukprot:TRINITY_DN1896_c0_g2_i1.p1 TRINITY_DN1896_c0_g2~~TRINITY_DN1896_c0_g2_i1.p1  ORF type:complete len:690 (+),score=155.55 TRINITY_DN1896_c0_g2_i1:43-2112(+)